MLEAKQLGFFNIALKHLIIAVIGLIVINGSTLICSTANLYVT